jgi:predicted neutral ceramidase superfamily lipid hydrolase
MSGITGRYPLSKYLLQVVYRRYIKPKSQNEDIARREFIFNILLLGFLALTLFAAVSTLISYVNEDSAYHDVSPFILSVPSIVLLSLYLLSRRKFTNYLAYTFVALCFFLGTYSLSLYSYVLPQGLLVYVLVIIISGILLSARASLVMTIIVVASLILLAYLQITHVIHPDLSEL